MCDRVGRPVSGVRDYYDGMNVKGGWDECGNGMQRNVGRYVKNS